MRAVDVRNIIRIVQRPHDHVHLPLGPPRTSWRSWSGYEYAAAGECRFTKILQRPLPKRHNRDQADTPWTGRTRSPRLAERRSLDWIEVYLLVSSEVLSAAAEGQDAERSG